MEKIERIDWIAAGTVLISCIAVILLYIQTIIFKRQTSIAEKQAGFMETQTQIARQQLDSINYQEQERQKEKTRQQKELLTAFKLELIDNYRESEYNGLHAVIEPNLRMTILKNDAMEELLRRGFPENWNKESIEKIEGISRFIKDINRAVYYRDRLDPWRETDAGKFAAQNKVIKEGSNELESLIFRLNEDKLDGLGEFLT